MTESAWDGRLLRLAPEDNVAAATTTLEAGEVVQMAGQRVQLLDRIPTGHKVAIASIAAGQPVRKYGLPIGSATVEIVPGQYVHTHNLASNYLPTYTLSR